MAVLVEHCSSKIVDCEGILAALAQFILSNLLYLSFSYISHPVGGLSLDLLVHHISVAEDKLHLIVSVRIIQEG